jgi:Mg2+/Co2+ transporter CorB
MNAFDSAVTSVVVLIGLVAASAFFSSTEIAVFSLPREWLDDRVAAKDRRASILAELRDDPHRLLVTLLVGNNVVNVAISSILAVLLAERFSGEVAVALTTVVAGSVVLVFGEILPKAYGLGHAESWALTAARPVWVVERLLLPVVLVFDFVTRRAGAMVGGDPDIEEPYTDTDPKRAGGSDPGEGAK